MSTTYPQTIDPAQANKETPLQEDQRAVEFASVLGYKPEGSSGLVFCYHGGIWGGLSIAADDVTATNTATNYVVVNRSTGVVSIATSTTNWNNTTDYARMYRLVASGGVLTNVGGDDWDYRGGAGGAHGGGGGSASDASGVTYTPTVDADWDETSDPGNVDDALDQLAERVTDLEAGGAGDEHYDVDGTPASDDTYAGRAITGVNAGATIAQWEAVCMSSGGEWILADATDDTLAPCRGLAAAAGTDNNPMTVVTEGVIRNDAWNWTTVGGDIYLSTTAGGLTQTPPSGSGEFLQKVGYALSADVMYVQLGPLVEIE
jgi:hypothetical protein